MSPITSRAGSSRIGHSGIGLVETMIGLAIGLLASAVILQTFLVSEGFSLAIEYDRETDGRWLADIPALPGVTVYGRTKRQATASAKALALRLIADRLEHRESLPF